MDFQNKKAKNTGVTDFWQKKVTCRLNVVSLGGERDRLTAREEFIIP